MDTRHVFERSFDALMQNPRANDSAIRRQVLGEFEDIPQPAKPPEGKADYPKAIGPDEALHRVMASKNHQHNLSAMPPAERKQWMDMYAHRWLEGRHFTLVDLALEKLDRKAFDLDEQKVQSLVDKPPKDDGNFPIVSGFDKNEGAEHVILDGNHRAEAAIRRGDKTMRAYVRDDLIEGGGAFAETCAKVAFDFLKGLVPAAKAHINYIAATAGEARAHEVADLAHHIVEGRKNRKDKRVKLNDVLAVHRQAMLSKNAALLQAEDLDAMAGKADLLREVEAIHGGCVADHAAELAGDGPVTREHIQTACFAKADAPKPGEKGYSDYFSRVLKEKLGQSEKTAALFDLPGVAEERQHHADDIRRHAEALIASDAKFKGHTAEVDANPVRILGLWHSRKPRYFIDVNIKDPEGKAITAPAGDVIQPGLSLTIDPDKSYLDGLSIAPGFHGRGYGAALMGISERLASDSGTKRIGAHSVNPISARMALGAGYQVVGRPEVKAEHIHIERDKGQEWDLERPNTSRGPIGHVSEGRENPFSLLTPIRNHWGRTAEKAAADDSERPTVFLGGKVSGPDGNWRKSIADGIRDAGWDAIDPKKKTWTPEKDIYKEVEGMLNADLVVFHEGGTFTKREKKLLDAVGKPYTEVDTPDEVRELVGDPATAGMLAKAAFNASLIVDPIRKFTPSVFPQDAFGHPITSLRAAAAGDSAMLILLRRIRENPADFHGIIALNAMLAAR